MTIKSIFDIFWIFSSLAFYLFFYLITELNNAYLIKISHKGFVFDGAYLILLFLVLLPFCTLYIFNKFIKEDENITIQTIRPAETNYIPTYIGYFVIATSINSACAFYIISLVIAVLIYFTKMFYFNPMLLFAGYQYYEVVDSNGANIVLITKIKDIKIATKLQKLKRLNNYTFIGGKEELDG